MTDHRPHHALEQALEALRVEVETARVPSGLHARIARRAEERARHARLRRRLVVFAGAAAAVLLGIASLWWRSRPVELAGFQIASASPDFHHEVSDGLLTIESGQASLIVKGLQARVSPTGNTRLRREARGVRVVRGSAAFEVDPRKEQAFAVYVSAGSIEVLGTRFTVVQGDGAGEVRLAEGTIRFVDLQGRRTVLAPGQRLRWPPEPTKELPAPSPQPVPAPPPPRRSPQAVPSPASRAPSRQAPLTPPPALLPDPLEPEARAAQQRRILSELDGLRIRREDERLVSRLDQILAEGLPEPLRERLSFERCDVLAHEAGQEQRACAEIGRHLRAYPAGEYTPRLEQSLRSLECKP